MDEQSLPPQYARMALYSAGGGFGGALLAIIVAKILAGPCCCPHERHELERLQPATQSAVMEQHSTPRRNPAG